MQPFAFSPAAYGPAVQSLLTPPRLPELGPGTPTASARTALHTFDPLRDLGPVADRAAARACHAGLWLYHDYLDESHTISQEIETPTGSFWHAVMHRREPDPSNSKYWWRRVGNHPVLALLREYTPALGYDYTTPEAFVDFCEAARGTSSPAEDLAKHVQLLEWHLLFDWCARTATG
jgi:hypothetical protein